MMEMFGATELLATYLFGLKYVAMAAALLLVVSGLDDLFIDVVFWVRRAIRAFTVYARHDRAGFESLQDAGEKPLAIMVPAWQEKGVVGPMADLAASTIDYENYHIFVGTYPNDPDTQSEVDEVTARFPNVHKVICARPGPTSKADCLNNILDAILQFERQAKFHFEGFILHDAEDVISDQELRLFNSLVDRNDLVQIPVYPFERSWHHFTSMHYLDEFAELHGKDLIVREALAGQVPSAGVGTCFSRRAMLALLEDGDGIAFDVQSLTEDYDIGFRLKSRGMREIFVRFPILRGTAASDGKSRLGRSVTQANVVCVREYFPDTLAAAVRQKARWIVGIAFQGYRTHRWSGSFAVKYFLWRDRRGVINNFVSFAAMLIFVQLVLLWLVQQAWDDAPRFLSIFDEDPWFRTVLGLNLALMVNRLAQRMFFVTSYYGIGQGLMCLPRLFWGVLINFLANFRAIRQIVAQGDPRRVAWDKTTHDFPSLGECRLARRPLGSILLAQGALTRVQLDHALANRVPGLRLGSSMVHDGIISPGHLAAAVADQAGVESRSIGLYDPPRALLEQLPADLAVRYAALPVREEGEVLVVATEMAIDPVSLAALSRRLGRPVRVEIALRGEVTVQMRRLWLRMNGPDPYAELDALVSCGSLGREQVPLVWSRYVCGQVSLGEILMSVGHVQPTAFRSLMLRFASSLQLGEFLVSKGVIDAQTLRSALALQLRLQPTLASVVSQCRGMQPTARDMMGVA